MIDISSLITLALFIFLFIECLITEQKCPNIECKLGFQNLAFMCFCLSIMVLLYSIYMYIENYCKKYPKVEKVE